MQNPLENEVVLATLFKFLGKSSLNSCRQVCKLWRQVSLPHWVKYVTITCGKNSDSITKSQSPEDFLKKLESYSRFRSDFKTPQYENFEWLDGDDFIIVNQFLPRCGNHIKKLKINYPYNDEERLRKVLGSELTPILQDLELSLKSFDRDRDIKNGVNKKTRRDLFLEDFPCKRVNINLTRLDLEIRQRVPFRWIDLLSHFPHLQDLSVMMFDFDDKMGIWKDDKCHLQDLISALKKLRKTDGGKWALTNLRLWCRCQTKMCLESLTSLDIPLKSCRVLGGSQAWNIPRGIAARFHSTLEKLTIDDDYFSYPTPASKFLWNETLKELHLQQDIFHSLSFLKSLPNLKTLSIGSFECVNKLVERTIAEEDLVGEVLLSMTSLSLGKKDYGVEKPLSELSITMLMSWMPNLERFVASWSKESFEWVCENSGNLKLSHLGLVCCSYDLDEDCISENVVKFTGLRSFEMCESESFSVTAKSILNGFLHMPQLEKLTICEHSRYKIDSEALDELKKAVPDVKVVKYIDWDYLYYGDQCGDDDDSSDESCQSGDEHQEAKLED